MTQSLAFDPNYEINLALAESFRQNQQFMQGCRIWGDGAQVGLLEKQAEGSLRTKKTTLAEAFGLDKKPEDITATIICPHDDDPVIALSTTMRQALEEGMKVCTIQTSDGAMGYGTNADRDIIYNQRNKATYESYGRIGINPDNMYLLNFPDASLDKFKGRWKATLVDRLCHPHLIQEGHVGLLNSLVIALRKQKPDIVIYPSDKDIHSDHITTAIEAYWSLYQANAGIWTDELGAAIPFPKAYEYVVYGNLDPTIENEIQLFHPRGHELKEFFLRPFLDTQEELIEGVRGHLQTPVNVETAAGKQKLCTGMFDILRPMILERADIESRLEAGGTGWITHK